MTLKRLDFGIFHYVMTQYLVDSPNGGSSTTLKTER